VDGATDNELIAFTLSGNKAAFGVLIERYTPMVTRLAQRMVSDPDVAHDLAQDAFLEAFLSLQDLREIGRFRSWLYGITLNVCRAHRRSQRADVFSLEALSGGLHREPADYGPTPEEIAERLDLCKTLLNAVGMLSQANRAAVLLVYYEECSLSEAADILGISVTAIKGRLHKARLHLQERLRSQVDLVGKHEGAKNMIPVKVVDVQRIEILKDSGIPLAGARVILYDEPSRRALIIWTGESEGLAVGLGLVNYEMPRPMTPVFTSRLLQAAGATIESVEVSAIKDDTYYATVHIRTGDRASEVDARPSDALALAVLLGTPIYVSAEVMEQWGIAVPEGRVPTGQGIAAVLAHLETQQQVWTSHRAKQREGQTEAQHKQSQTEEMEKIILASFG
jgi:RNA polymerase sigma factor (sigma-70 family)